MASYVSVDTLMKLLGPADLRPTDKTIRQVLQYGQQAVPGLIQIASDHDLLHSSEPEVYAPLHALRLLGELMNPEIATMLLLLANDMAEHEEERVPAIWLSDAPQLLARLGSQGIDLMFGHLDNPGLPLESRCMAGETLGFIVGVAPEAYDQIVAGLQTRLESDDTAVVTSAVVGLALLGVTDSYQQIMRLYREKKIDANQIAASEARQLLLSKAEKRLACARHPLAERYEQHGPFPESYYQQ